ncbi:MAG: SemiSWEET family transporter [Candidatus Kerfeldbacteria bacterium]
MNWIEINNFGWNAQTIGAVGILVFVGWNVWAMLKQNKLIWSKQKGTSVSIVWFAYFAGYQLIGVVYGFEIKSLTMVINGLSRGFFLIPILIGLWKFKGYNKIEKISTVLIFVAVCTSLIIPWIEWYFFIFSWGVLGTMALQPIEIWRNRDSGVVDIRMIIVYILAGIFWLSYVFTINDLVLMIFNSVSISIMMITLVIWLKFKKKG